jgi:[NiFe] hydrogenase diaphorase moiety large subunit
MEQHGKYIIRLCQTVACQMRNEFRPIVGRLKKELGIDFGQTTDDGLFSLEYVNCIGMCDRGPAMLINDDVYPDLTVEKVSEILAMYRKRGQSADTKQAVSH